MYPDPWEEKAQNLWPKKREPQRVRRENQCIRIKINRMKDIKVRKGWPEREVF